MLVVPSLSEPIRIDVYLAEALKLTRAKIKALLSDGKVLVNGHVVNKAGTLLRGGEEIEYSLPKDQPSPLKHENIPLDILHEDESVIVINKPPGLVVHPAAGHWDGTLVNALLFHFKKLSGIDPKRPGIVHRLDKDTSGVLLIAKTDAAHLSLSQQLKERIIQKYYQVLVQGRVSANEGTINKPIGRHPKDRKKMSVIPSGRHAITHYKVMKRFERYTLLECKIETGRTHQIRVHLASIGHPVVGDSTYGKPDRELGATRQLLHAWKIVFHHPVTNELIKLEASLPADFLRVME